jgi:DNA modification methylase
VSAVVTDPPYDLVSISKRWGKANQAPTKDSRFVNMARGFMGQSWDGTGIAFDPATWAEVLRVMRPGAYLLAFGGTRTYHRMTCAIEDAGFIVRDCIMWLHGQGFPKSHNIGDGIGTALKPAVEPIVLAQKPLDGTYKNNYARWGCGALNIDAARIGTGDDRASGGGLGLPIRGYHGWDARTDRPTGGRWPANAVFSHADGCEEVGARKVKAGGGPAAVIRTSAGYEGASLGKDSRAEGTLCTSHRDADGMETVSAWRCVEGGTVTTYAYEYKLDALTPLSEPAHLLDRLQSLLQDLREHSTNGNSLLQNASAFYRSEHRQSAAGPDGLSDAVAYALRLTELPGFQSGYQSCPRFCDAHVHHVLTACQDGLPSLIDALDRVHSVLSELVHSPQSPVTGRPSSLDDARLYGRRLHTHESKTVPADLHEVLPVLEPHTEGTTQSAQPQNGQRANTSWSNTSEHDSHKTPTDSVGKSAAVRLLSLLVFDLAWRFILPAHIIQRVEIDINLPSCPVAELDRQSGVSTSGKPVGTRNAVGGFQNSTPGMPLTGYGDSGTASRFFFVAKPSRAERERGLAARARQRVNDGRDTPIDNPYQRGETARLNTHPTVKSTALMRHLLTLVVPPGGIVLDPFAGSGSTGVAAAELGMEFVGIEREEAYYRIALARIEDAELRMEAERVLPLFAHAGIEL